jgi:hypothetical protein
MSLPDPRHLDVCQNLEVGLKHEYEINPRLTDNLAILALDNSKIAIKQRFGFAKNEYVSSHEEIQGIIEWCVSVGLDRVDKVNALTLKEFLSCIDRIKGSMKLYSDSGNRGYYEFIRNYLP